MLYRGVFGTRTSDFVWSNSYRNNLFSLKFSFCVKVCGTVVIVFGVCVFGNPKAARFIINTLNKNYVVFICFTGPD